MWIEIKPMIVMPTKLFVLFILSYIFSIFSNVSSAQQSTSAETDLSQENKLLPPKEAVTYVPLLAFRLSVSAHFVGLDDAHFQLWGTQGFGISVLYQPALVPKKVHLKVGSSIGWDWYRFKGEGFFLSHAASQTRISADFPTSVGKDITNSYFGHFYFGLPLEFAIYPSKKQNKGIFFTLGGYLRYLLATERSIDYRIGEKSYTSRLVAPYAIQPWQYGATFRIGWGPVFELSYQWQFSSLFSTINGPDRGAIRTHRLGISANI